MENNPTDQSTLIKLLPMVLLSKLPFSVELDHNKLTVCYLSMSPLSLLVFKLQEVL
jgi:hypothetical protein